VTGLTKVKDLGHRRGAYKAEDDQGRAWFAKPCHPSAPGQLKFAEVVVSALARHLGLRWPLAIPHHFGNGPGVLIRWVEGLRQVVPENGALPFGWDDLLAQHQNLDQLAGFSVFSRWTDAGDTKNDVLQADPGGQFWFLDGKYYVGCQTPTEWKFGSAYSRGDAFNGFQFTEPLAGQPSGLFTPWLDRIPSLTPVFDEACASVPSEWLPTGLPSLRDGLFGDAHWSLFRSVFANSVKDRSGESPSW